jgi:hypothetical protein
MYESYDPSKIILEVKNSNDPYGILMPKYMKHVNNILQAQEIINKLKWENEGEMVIYSSNNF